MSHRTLLIEGGKKLIAKYKFDSTIYDVLPTFNDDFTYEVEDESYTSTTIRRIYSNWYPTAMSFAGTSDAGNNGLLRVMYLDTRMLTSMYEMFAYCHFLESVDLSESITSKVTTMSRMFYYCDSALTTVNMAGIDTSNVTSMYSMFYCCSYLEDLDITGWDTSKVTNMKYMFYWCNSIESLDLSHFNVSNVTSFYYIIYRNQTLRTLNISNWDTSNGIEELDDFFDAFFNYTYIETLIMRNFVNSEIDDIRYMFSPSSSYGNSYTDSLLYVDLTGAEFDNSNNYGCSYLFYNNDVIQEAHIGFAECGYRMNYMFYGCTSLTTVTMDGLYINSSAAQTYYMFYGCNQLQTVDFSNVKKLYLTYADSMFYNCTKLSTIDLSNDNVRLSTLSSATANGMFYNCGAKTINLTNFITSKLTSANTMFYSCNSLTSVDLTGCDFSSCEFMRGMFEECTSLTGSSIDWTLIDISSCHAFSDMFYGCTSLTDLDLSSWCSNVDADYTTWEYGNYTMQHMFYGCTSLSSLDLRKFNTDCIISNSYASSSLENVPKTCTVYIGSDFDYDEDDCDFDGTFTVV